MNPKRLSVLILLSVLLLSPTRADEGMWLLQMLKEQRTIDLMRAKGLNLEADSIYSSSSLSLKDAVGIFDGGCTGEIVSPEGLILTNHHCGYSSIQKLSSVGHDYLTDGFWAESPEDELPSQGLSFKFVDRIEDVTYLVERDIQDGLTDEYGALTNDYLTSLSDRLLSEGDLRAEPGIEAQVLPYYAGNSFYLVYYKVYEDVRLVAAPPSSIGKFGGETDNWMWPRHTCDFSVFRIYAGQGGEPRAYASDNVPLKTPEYLRISLEGYDEEDFAMILGFPGSTSRYLTQAEVRERMETANRAYADIRGVRLEVLSREMAQSDAVRLQYANKYASASNYWKNAIGMNEAILRNGVLEIKRAQDEAFDRFSQDHSDYRGLVDLISRIVTRAIPLERRLYYLDEALGSAIEFGSPYQAMENLRTGLSSGDKALIAQSKDYLETAFHQIHGKDYDHEVDRKVAKAVLPVLRQALSGEDLPEFFQVIDRDFQGDTGAFVDEMYDHSIMSSRKNLKAFLEKPTIRAIDGDLATLYSRSKEEAFQKALEEYLSLDKDRALLKKRHVRGLMEMQDGNPSYPDANFTLRLSWGQVKGYDPVDAVHYQYLTTADGVLEKEDPTVLAFTVPSRLRELILGRDYGRYGTSEGTLPVCFLTTNDITGGNSGSPVLNSRGQLIGLAFDGNWESLSGDIHFDHDLQRCINVDIRYVLFVIERLGQCRRLIDEMTLIE